MKPHFWLVKFEVQTYVELYGFPKIGVPPHHEIFSWGILIYLWKNHGWFINVYTEKIYIYIYIYHGHLNTIHLILMKTKTKHPKPQPDRCCGHHEIG